MTAAAAAACAIVFVDVELVSQSLADDIVQMCSSTGYVCLVVFCFFVQLGGVHAVVDILDVFIDILHVLSRITSARASVRDPSILAIISDFAAHDPAALVMLAFLVCIIPGTVIWAIFRHTRLSYMNSTITSREPQASQRHHSWLLGICIQMEEEGHGGQSRFIVSDVYAGGPACKTVRVGDELLGIDGLETPGMTLPELVKAVRGDKQPGRLSLAQRAYWTAASSLGAWWGSAGGRGSQVELSLLRRKDGRKRHKNVSVTRGNWYGRYDPAVELQMAEDTAGSNPCRQGEVGVKHKRRKGSGGSDCDAPATDAATAAGCAAALDTSGAGEEVDDDERVCRICQCTEEEAPEQGKLFSPCHCRGTMRYIHEGCLEKWRRVSANASSTFKCDQCSYFYRVRHTGLANFVRKPGVVELSALAIFVLGIIATGPCARNSQQNTTLDTRRHSAHSVCHIVSCSKTMRASNRTP